MIIPLLGIIYFSWTSVPQDFPKQESMTITDTGNTKLGILVAKWEVLNGEKSGFLPLPLGMDGLGARLELAERAEKSIDLQYFMMKDDTAGTVILDALLKAADRGVRIRFLLDDIFTTESDLKLSLLNQHPNIEVRSFNPISRRGIYALNFAAHFARANRRMHNKSFTVDNAVSIIGGRNIADEYFQLDKAVTFDDFDALALGPIARELSNSFDLYWNHILAIPFEQISNIKNSKILAVERANIRASADKIYASTYRQALESKVLQALINDQEKLYGAAARVLSDDPEKLDHKVSDEYMILINELNEVLKAAQQEIIYITPYYVPTDEDVQALPELIDKGVRVVVLTNSLASTNHIPVHAAYAAYREEVIDAGVELFEARANAGGEAIGGNASAMLTLHAKLILIDRRYLFVGSLNLDPRSFEINSEMGVLIDSEELTGMMADTWDNEMPKIAYHVVKNARGKMEWHGVINGEQVIETKEPLTNRWRRFKAWLMKLAPDKEL